MMLNNDCRFIGNIAQQPHFQRVGQSAVPFLRLYLAVDSNGADGTSFIRVVAYGDLALQACPYLQVGSRLLIHSHYRQRRRRDNGEMIHEFVADHIVFMDGINWERGDAMRAQSAVAKT